MWHCDLTLRTPEENLACDEALLDLCEEGLAGELLRFWEPSEHFVVLGYANRTATEVNLEFCRRQAIPVLRRCSGGGTVLQGPGCLNYSLILPMGESGLLHSIPATNQFILQRHQQALAPLLRAPVEIHAPSDLAVSGLKFSGNAQRRRRRFLLFHGVFLLQADIGLMEKVLPLPSKQPGYRRNRSHTDFLVNLKLPPSAIKAALVRTWMAQPLPTAIPFDRITRLADEKYRLDEWNFKF